MLEYDVAIVGGGPIGGHIARNIAEKKFKVAIFEKNKEIGRPINCAGLITPRVFEYFGISQKSIIQNKVKGANIHSPSGKILSIGGGRVHALVIDRSKFDREIITQAEGKGADLFLENNILSAQKTNKNIELKTSKDKDIQCKLLIGADGPYSKIRDRFALPEPTEFLRGIGAELTNADLDPNFVEIFIGNNIAPGFFAWIIPTNKEGSSARVGLCISQEATNSPKHYFSNLFTSKYSAPYIKEANIERHIGGIIPLGFLKKTYAANVMIVGDAAAQVKPTSGGGIYTGLLSANHCSSIAVDALQKNNFSIQQLKKYQKLWSADLGRELFIGMKFRKIYKHLTDKQIDKYIERFQNPKIVEIITKYGDIDYPSKLVRHMLKKSPSLLKLLPKAFRD